MKRVFQHLHRLWQDLRTSNSFLQNSAWLFSASALSILVQFIFFPILSRIYEPDAYGAFGIFNAIVVNLAVIAGLNLNQAFVIPKSTGKFIALLQVSLRITFLICLLSFIVLFFLGDAILGAFGVQDLGWYVYLIAPTAFIVAFDKMLIDWATRIKAFKRFAIYNFQTSLISKLFNMGYGLGISSGPSGLILTHILNLGLRITLYLSRIIGPKRAYLRVKTSAVERKAALQEFRNYPMFLLPGNFLNSFSNQLLILIPPVLGMDLTAVGIYSFSLLVLDLMQRMIASAFGPVFLQKAAEVQNDRSRSLGSISWKLFRSLNFLVFVPCLILFVGGEPLYGFVFGENWTEAGQVAELLALSYFFRLSISPLSTLFAILRKEKFSLYYQIFLFTMRLSGLIVGFYLQPDVIGVIYWYTIFNAVTYLVLTVVIFRLLKHRTLMATGFQILLFGILLTLGLAIKSLLF